jgi:hypothetical protein
MIGSYRIDRGGHFSREILLAISVIKVMLNETTVFFVKS